MIQRIDSYTAECNSCKTQYECTEGWVLFVDYTSAADNMLDDGWHVVDDDCYCPKCHEVDEEDNIIIKQQS